MNSSGHKRYLNSMYPLNNIDLKRVMADKAALSMSITCYYWAISESYQP